ncbi:MAG: arylsulfatase [Pseudomonadota bacterium]
MRRREFIKAGTSLIAASSLRAAAERSVQASRAHPHRFTWRQRSLKRRPNIVVAILDDVGFGDLGCYGSELDTPCVDRLAAEGTRFNNFHVTALCAPTRACLLTGRNAHAVGVGNIAEWGRDLPGYRGWVRQDAATLAEMLRPLDYTTLAIGKWHLSKISDQNATGPYDLWPVGRGFDRWYGFHGNAMDHFHPELFENTVEAHPDKSDGYHLSEDLVDHGIQYVQDHLTASPERPFFLYLAFGACHFPFHAPADAIGRHRGRYAAGWDALRAERFARQRALGLLPDSARLAPNNANVPDWAGLAADERRIAERGQEVYAAFLEHTDAQLGRLIAFLDAENVLDDSLVVVLSDNGAATSGQPLATFDLRRSAYIDRETNDHLLANLERMGGEDSQCMYGPGWAQASNTPLKWYKGDTYGGGTRSPLIVRWPGGGVPANGINGQYHHVIDVVPSLLEMIDAPLPTQVNGQPPLPLQGKSFAYSFDHPAAPTSKTLQYFETYGDRAVWADGWKAVVRHRAGTAFEDDVWELYQLERDFCELDNLADRHPDRLEALIALWFEEARRYDVLPMSDDLLTMYKNVVPEPRARYVFYPGMTRLDRLSAPDIYAYDSTIIADVDLDHDRAEGVLLASGDGAMGYELFMLDGFLHFVYVYTRERRYRQRSARRVPAGKHLVGLAIARTGADSAEVTLLIDGEGAGALRLPRMWPIYAPNSGLRCGENTGAPISKAYEGRFVFGHTLHRVVVDIDV